MNNGTPEYTRRYLPTFNPYDLRRPSIFAVERTNTNRYSNSFYLYCIKAWNNLDPTIWKLPNIFQFKNALQLLIRPKKRYLFRINDRVGVNLLMRLTLVTLSFTNLITGLTVTLHCVHVVKVLSLPYIFSCTASCILI